MQLSREDIEEFKAIYHKEYGEDISDSDITEVNIPTGVPRLYELDARMQPQRAEYLGDSDAIAKAAQAVADLAKA